MYVLIRVSGTITARRVAIVECDRCGYWEEHWEDRGREKAGKACDRCRQ